MVRISLKRIAHLLITIWSITVFICIKTVIQNKHASLDHGAVKLDNYDTSKHISHFHDTSKRINHVHDRSQNAKQANESSQHNNQVHGTSKHNNQVHDASKHNNQIHDASEHNNQVHDASELNNQVHDTSKHSNQVHDASKYSNQVHDTSKYNNHVHDASKLDHYTYDTSKHVNHAHNTSEHNHASKALKHNNHDYNISSQNNHKSRLSPNNNNQSLIPINSNSDEKIKMPKEISDALNSQSPEDTPPQPSKYGNNTRLIIYNAIPKSGATTTVYMFNLWKNGNGIKYRTYYRRINTESAAATLLPHVKRSSLPILFNGHNGFVEFESLGVPSPPHIQLMREPVSQAISLYSFLYQTQRMNSSEWNLTLKECMVSSVLCPALHKMLSMSILHHFCGQCIKDMSNAANHAKQNIVKYHSVVGVTEDIPGFRTLLEYMHPHYFEGITQYPIKVLNHGKESKEWPDWAKDILLKNRSADIDVYKFVKQRYHRHIAEARKTMEQNLQTGTPAK